MFSRPTLLRLRVASSSGSAAECAAAQHQDERHMRSPDEADAFAVDADDRLRIRQTALVVYTPVLAE